MNDRFWQPGWRGSIGGVRARTIRVEDVPFSMLKKYPSGFWVVGVSTPIGWEQWSEPYGDWTKAGALNINTINDYLGYAVIVPEERFKEDKPEIDPESGRELCP